MATSNDNTHQKTRVSAADIRSIALLVSLLAALLVSEAGARPVENAAVTGDGISALGVAHAPGRD